ncbi:glutamic acid-rich protein-like isoform X2 [Eriocheir sinensis]|uniref:glutamic acid-rich protein-like isoform X2 n=1 Tax=Eriocheir sinensis TaxID=95602 RepID=UPI0021C8B1E5|nr:glutamic acid-rich protein-like isoform X2 [Eriocheir sinensis]
MSSVLFRRGPRERLAVSRETRSRPRVWSAVHLAVLVAVLVVASAAVRGLPRVEAERSLEAASSELQGRVEAEAEVLQAFPGERQGSTVLKVPVQVRLVRDVEVVSGKKEPLFLGWKPYKEWKHEHIASVRKKSSDKLKRFQLESNPRRGKRAVEAVKVICKDSTCKSMGDEEEGNGARNFDEMSRMFGDEYDTKTGSADGGQYKYKKEFSIEPSRGAGVNGEEVSKALEEAFDQMGVTADHQERIKKEFIEVLRVKRVTDENPKPKSKSKKVHHAGLKNWENGQEDETESLSEEEANEKLFKRRFDEKEQEKEATLNNDDHGKKDIWIEEKREFEEEGEDENEEGEKEKDETREEKKKEENKKKKKEENKKKKKEEKKKEEDKEDEHEDDEEEKEVDEEDSTGSLATMLNKKLRKALGVNEQNEEGLSKKVDEEDDEEENEDDEADDDEEEAAADDDDEKEDEAEDEAADEEEEEKVEDEAEDEDNEDEVADENDDKDEDEAAAADEDDENKAEDEEEDKDDDDKEEDEAEDEEEKDEKEDEEDKK